MLVTLRKKAMQVIRLVVDSVAARLEMRILATTSGVPLPRAIKFTMIILQAETAAVKTVLMLTRIAAGKIVVVVATGIVGDGRAVIRPALEIQHRGVVIVRQWVIAVG